MALYRTNVSQDEEVLIIPKEINNEVVTVLRTAEEEEKKMRMSMSLIIMNPLKNKKPERRSTVRVSKKKQTGWGKKPFRKGFRFSYGGKMLT